MIIAIDVHYKANYAKSVAVLFPFFEDETPLKIESIQINEVADYEPGQFYKRELPCILAILNEFSLADISTIIIDGYVFLDEAGKWGLGAYLYDALEEKIPIIGVAKSAFRPERTNVQAIYRGESTKALYVTSIGMPLSEASEAIKSMYGSYRMPDLLRILDQETKQD